MDIRNFFGNSKKKLDEKPKESKVENDDDEMLFEKNDNSSSNTDQNGDANDKVKRKRMIIDDDEDEDDGKVDSTIVKTLPIKNEQNEMKDILTKVPLKQELKPVDKPVKVASVFSASKTKKDDVNPTITKATGSSSSSNTGTDLPQNTADPSVIPEDLLKFINWKVGESIPYLALVETFEEISNVSGRLDKEKLFARLFRAVIVTTPSELDSIVYLASNNVSPAYEGMELGIGDSLLVKAVCAATGRKKEAVEEAYQREGDLGTVALSSRASQTTLGFAAKPKPLLAKFVLEQFRLITQIKGDKAQGRKVEVIKALMVKCQGCEAKYIVRALQGKLRIGTAEQTVLVSLAHAFAQTPTAEVCAIMQADKEQGKFVAEEAAEDSESEEEEDGLKEAVPVASEETEQQTGEAVAQVVAVELTEKGEVDVSHLLDKVHDRETPEAKQLRTKAHLTREENYNFSEIAVKRAFSECPNLTMLVKALLSLPMYRLFQACRLTIGVPVAPMLAKPTKEINEVLKRLTGQPFTMEYKYDGERAQVHLMADNSVKIFSRNSEDNTNKYPDLLEVMKKARKEGVVSCIIDAEVVAYDREKGCLLPFQVLSTRKRKVEDGEEDNQKVKIILQAFDLLFLNGKSLLRETLRTRRSIMHSSFQHSEGFFHFASGCDHVENGDTTPIEAFLQEACGAMCEGLMVKTLDSNASYEPSKRSLNWLKLKKDYIDGMGVCDSVDLVVLGGYIGHGKRTGTYGAYLMACYDHENDEYQSVCKVGTGLKDEDLLRLCEQMKQHKVPSKCKPLNYNVGENLFPDDWFEPAVVWELQAADLSKSPQHKGGIGKVGDGRGIGLRFPRYIRDRPDKKPENATRAEQIVDMYLSQGGVGEGAGDGEAAADDDDDDGI